MSPQVMVAVFILSVLILIVPITVYSETFDRLIDEDADIGELIDDIPPLDPDLAQIDDFAALPSFTMAEASLVVAYRDSAGTLFAPNGYVAIVPGLSTIQQAVLDQLSALKSTAKHPSLYGSLRSGIVHRPYDQELSDSKYYLRLTADHGHSLRLNAIGERDPFEPYALDHLSASVTWRPDDSSVVVIGDYRPSFGQRLLYSRYSRNYLNGADIFLSNPSAIENTSYEEAFFLRGGYLSVSRGLVRIDAFTSRRSLDATLDSEGNAVTIRTAGLHGEGDPRGNLAETVHAMGVTAGGGGPWHLGLMGAISVYNPPLSRDDSERSQYDPDGERFSHLSLSGDLTAGVTLLFAEHVVMNSGEHASTAGIETGNDNMRASVALREYSPGYFALRSAGINSFGNTSNERGIYAAFQGSLPKRGSIAATCDIARTITRTYSAFLPVTRRRLNLLASYPLRRSLTGTCSFRSVDDIDTGERRRSLTLTLDQPMSVSKGTGWRAKAALSSDGGSVGMYGEGRFVWMMRGIRTTIVIAGFDISAYGARYYRSEPDVPGSGMSRPVWGRGGAAIMVVRSGLFAVRYRHVRSDQMETTHELRLQTDIRF